MRFRGPGFKPRSGLVLYYFSHSLNFIWCSANSWSWQNNTCQGKELGVIFDGENHIKGEGRGGGECDSQTGLNTDRIIGCYTLMTFRYLWQVCCKLELQLIDFMGSFIECKVRPNGYAKKENWYILCALGP